MCGTVGKLDQLVGIFGKSDCWMDDRQCDDALQLFKEVDVSWKNTKRLLCISSSLGTKYHYLWHPIGHIDEQSIEGFHKSCS